MNKESKKEIDARQQLELQLEPGEELLAYTGGAITGIVKNEPIYLGLSADRLILLRLKRGKSTGQALSIYRENIISIKWSGIWDRLKVKINKGEINIACGKSIWKKRVRDLLETHSVTPIPQYDGVTSNERRLRQIKVYQELGFIASAQELNQGAEPFSTNEMVSGILSKEMLAEKRLAFQVGAAFLFVNVGITILLFTLIIINGGSLLPNQLIPIIIDTIIGINLCKGKAHQWANWAIIRVALGLVVFGISSLVQGSVLDFIEQAAFCGSIILVLSGESKRTKTWASIGIYLIGYIGVFLLSLFNVMLKNIM